MNETGTVRGTAPETRTAPAEIPACDYLLARNFLNRHGADRFSDMLAMSAEEAERQFGITARRHHELNVTFQEHQLDCEACSLAMHGEVPRAFARKRAQRMKRELVALH